MFKVTIIDFWRCNACGQTDWVSHYYAGGRRISHNAYIRYYSAGADYMDEKGYVYDYTSERVVKKNGITRHYTEIYYKKVA